MNPLSKKADPTYPLLFETTISAGPPSFVDESKGYPLDLHDHIVERPAATFFFRAKADFKDAEIKAGDLLVVDRSLTPKKDQVILCIQDGAICLSLFCETSPSPLEIWGVVTNIIRKMP